jgi:DNA-binding response OmpR family regulator
VKILIEVKKTTMKQHRILIVEDDRPIAAMYELKLKSHDYTVKVAHDGQTGLAEAEAFRPHLILLDLKMPALTGEDMLEKLRATEWGSSLRVLILTNISKDEAPMKLRFLNVDRYIVKAHHTPSQVVEIVKEVLGNPTAT